MVGNLFGGSASSLSSNNATSANPANLKPGAPDSNSSTDLGSGGSTSNSSTFSSKFVPKYFTSEWSFSRIEVPGATKCIVGFTQTTSVGSSGAVGRGSGINKNNFAIMAICADGSYHKFVYNEKKDAFARDVYHMFVETDSR